MQKIDYILDRKMSRKEFLGVIGLGVITLLGLPTLMGILSGHDKHTGLITNPLLYGGGPYGGANKHST